MDQILIKWLVEYTGVSDVSQTTTFTSLNFDVFDEAVVCHWAEKVAQTSINVSEAWFETVGDLVDELSRT
jgi:hypothetical protein